MKLSKQIQVTRVIYTHVNENEAETKQTKRNKTQNKQATTTNKTEGAKEQKEEEERLPFISNRHKAAGCENNAHDQIWSM